MRGHFRKVPGLFVTSPTSMLDKPDGTFAVLMSLFTPILMFGRVALGAAPLWEVLLSVVGMALAILVLAWVAGRITGSASSCRGSGRPFPSSGGGCGRRDILFPGLVVA
jgi:hypothetical protein